MSGLAQLVPYFECQYPQIVAGSASQIEQQFSVVNSGGGMGDYIDPFAFPIPQYLSPGNNRGLGCAECGGTCGMGELFDGTGFLGSGLFTSSDPTEWGAGEFGALALGALGLYYLARGLNRTERAYRGAKRTVKGKVRKIKTGIQRRGRAAKTLVTGQ